LITFQREKWSDCVAEMRPLWPEHYEELSTNKDSIYLDCDEAKYEQGEAGGQLYLVTARADGKLVGYYYGILMGHLHYKSAGLMCYTDAYYLKPEYRGINGLRFIAAVIKGLRGLGVVKLYATTKVHLDMTKLWEFFGLKHTDNLLSGLL
jgi:hypothetical protein